MTQERVENRDENLTAFRPSRIWKRLPAERRLEAAELFWTDKESAEQQVEAVAAIAGHMKFRAKSVLGLPTAKKARYLVGLPSLSDTVAARVLVHYHLERQRPMMGAFLDSLGIAHEDGLITDEALAKPDEERLKRAAAQLFEAYPPDDVALYFATLVSQDPDTWGELAEAAEARFFSVLEEVHEVHDGKRKQARLAAKRRRQGEIR